MIHRRRWRTCVCFCELELTLLAARLPLRTLLLERVLLLLDLHPQRLPLAPRRRIRRHQRILELFNLEPRGAMELLVRLDNLLMRIKLLLNRRRDCDLGNRFDCRREGRREEAHAA